MADKNRQINRFFKNIMEIFVEKSSAFCKKNPDFESFE